VTADAAQISVCDRIDDLDRAEWSAVVAAAQAPVFYDYTFLRAYERLPLQQTEAFFYLRFGDPAVAVLPAYIQSTDDPLQAVSSLALPGRSPGDAILQTHVAHCYDTLIPARPGALTPRLVGQACETLGTLAAQAGLKWFAFLNVDGSSELADRLLSEGLIKLPIFTRHNKRIAGYESVDEFVAGIPSHDARYALRRSYRQAQRGEMQITHPDPASGAAAVELCQRTTSRHGTAAYYPEWFGEFVTLAADVMSVIEVRLAGRLASASICLRDPLRFHMWAGGIDYAVTEGIHSAFPLMLLTAMEEAIENRHAIFEAGRANDVVKQRFRLEPLPLFAFVGMT
jgi:predicted N-acyltransferase